MNTKKITVACAAVGAFGALAESVTNAVEVAELPAVVVEAVRLEKTPQEIPASVQVITREAIAASGAKDVVDLIGKLAPGVHVSGLGGANPALKQVSQRGYGENGFGRTLVLVDGERLDNPDMSTPNLAQVDLGSVRKVEILSGPQTVLQGDGASAGVINIVTDTTDYDTHGMVRVSGGSWNTFGTHAACRGGIADTGTQYWMGGGWDHSDGYRARSGYDIWNANGGVRQNWENGSYLRARAFYNDSDYELPGALTRAAWHGHATQAGAYDDDYYRRTSYGLNLDGKVVFNEENSLRLTGRASRRHMKSRTYGYWTVDYDMYSYEVTPEWINTTSLFDLDNELIAGTSFRYDRLHAADAAPSKYALNRMSMAYFGQDTLHLTDYVALQAGLRYQRQWNENTQLVAPHRNDDLFAYEFALLVTPLEDLKTYVKFARFFRSPFLDEYAARNWMPDSMLAPERGWSVDVGADYTFLEDFAVGGNAYLTKTKREVMYDPWFLYNNVNYRGDTLREGFDVRAQWEREKVAGVTLAYAFVRAEFDGGDYDGKRVPMVPESTLSLTGRVWLWDDCFVSGGYRYQSYMWSVSDFNNDGAYAGDKHARVPSFGLFHVGVQYAPSYARVKGLKVGFTIDNLFDRSYCDYATYGTGYYPGAGRSYMVTIGYEF